MPIVDFDFGCSAQSDAFFDRNPDFFAAFERVGRLLNRCFGRVCHYENRAQDICFSLGETCRGDYLEIVFLGVHGFNVAAMKLLRGLYERAVVHAYIVNEPEKVMRFMRFGAIQEYKAMRAALELVSEEDFNAAMGPENTVAKIAERREAVKDEFKATECSVCGMETPVSWDKRSVGAMARVAGEIYKGLYLSSYVIPNMHVHATLVSALRSEGREEGRKQSLQEHEAFFAIGQATTLMLQVIHAEDHLFNLGLAEDVMECETDVARLWFDVPAEPPAPPRS